VNELELWHGFLNTNVHITKDTDRWKLISQ